MPERRVVLLDQNVPRAIAVWLRDVRSDWTVHHATEVGLSLCSDADVFS